MPDPADRRPFDCAVVGGGLQGALIALAWLERRPTARVALVERESAPSTERTWCFQDEDLPPEARGFVAPLIEHRWPGYEVRFAGLRRTLGTAYFGFTAAHATSVLRQRFAARTDCAHLVGRRAIAIEARRVVLEDGSALEARLVVDATGAERRTSPKAPCGYQKFVGLELELAREHRLERPILMDACVDQAQGYRFFYALPFGPRRVLIEDTRFADTPELAPEELRAEVLRYAEQLGLAVSGVAREEHGVLPMPWGEHRFETAGPPLRAGYRGGWFHPATGYSFPLAVRLALLSTAVEPERLFDGPLRELARALEAPARHARALNRLLFRWFEPQDRAHVFERFYHLPEETIRRFYALRATFLDRARVIVGRPPRGFSLRARWRASERARGIAREVAHA
ncbi:MAG: lycopene beta-cyclase CrtY [Planctomycetes bacterium]|nr:lycopene beta-cyclase CrtY [Planctomycetota bacterium]